MISTQLSDACVWCGGDTFNMYAVQGLEEKWMTAVNCCACSHTRNVPETVAELVGEEYDSSRVDQLLAAGLTVMDFTSGRRVELFGIALEKLSRRHLIAALLQFGRIE